jgi:hypothetical protein
MDPKHRSLINRPGIATALGVLLLLAIIILISSEGFRLRDWQQLSAGVLALIAGALAYKGAMAKVDYDREVYWRTIEREKLGLYLRLQYGLESLSEDVKKAQEVLTGSKPGSSILKAWISIGAREEIDEVWKKLELVPISIGDEIVPIRNALLKARALWDDLDARVDITRIERLTLDKFSQEIDKLVASTGNLLASLPAIIEQSKTV